MDRTDTKDTPANTLQSQVHAMEFSESWILGLTMISIIISFFRNNFSCIWITILTTFSILLYL